MELSNSQDRIAGSEGQCVVRACPGSGKTVTAAFHVARLVEDWPHEYAGVATISFTNIASEEIASCLKGELGAKKALQYPHYLGTIDSFVNQFLFVPFGRLPMNLSNPPTLTGPPIDNSKPEESWLRWGESLCYKKRNCTLHNFSYDQNGRIHNIRDPRLPEACKLTDPPCVRNKRIFTGEGFATQSDANYFALRVLQKYPDVAQSLANRFPALVVDEVQDSSEIQMAIIDSLVDAGLDNVLLLGDPDQAIYEWRTASPHLFLEKSQAWRTPGVLSENWRSSQAICDAVSQISTLPDAMTACGETAEDKTKPEIWTYGDYTDLPGLVEAFYERCSELGISWEKSAVVCRSESLLHNLQSGGSPPPHPPWSNKHTRYFAKAKYLSDEGVLDEAMGIIQKGVLCVLGYSRMREGRQKVLREYGLASWRTYCSKVIQRLPSTNDTTLGEWEDQANRSLAGEWGDEARLKIKKRSPYPYTELTFDQVFGTPAVEDGRLHDTIHAVKGRTFDAIMVVLKHRSGTNHNYSTLLKDRGKEGYINSEELRIVYVGITRPRQFLVLCVPDEDLTVWSKVLLPEK